MNRSMASRPARVFAATIVTLTALGLAALVWREIDARQSHYTDGDTIKAPYGRSQPADILWAPPTPHPDPINDLGEEYEPRISPDGRTLVFVRGRAGENAELWMSERLARGWSEPAPLDAVNSASDELGPSFAFDGETLYFYSDRDGGSGGYDIWATTRGADGWREPVNLGPGVNSRFNDYGPAPTPDGDALYFSSNRPRDGEPVAEQAEWPATLREERSRRDYDLYVSALTPGGAADAVPLTELNTDSDEGAPAVSPFGDFIYFASDRP
ncbi:MAG: hypothetical protein VYC34_08280, partial [Planctomycetota bacterium]|nr:hypothetical protein [Planctomycetota bacterium]